MGTLFPYPLGSLYCSPLPFGLTRTSCPRCGAAHPWLSSPLCGIAHQGHPLWYWVGCVPYPSAYLPFYFLHPYLSSSSSQTCLMTLFSNVMPPLSSLWDRLYFPEEFRIFCYFPVQPIRTMLPYATRKRKRNAKVTSSLPVLHLIYIRISTVGLQ